MKRFICIFLIIIMIFGCCTIVFAAEKEANMPVSGVAYKNGFVVGFMENEKGYVDLDKPLAESNYDGEIYFGKTVYIALVNKNYTENIDDSNYQFINESVAVANVKVTTSGFSANAKKFINTDNISIVRKIAVSNHLYGFKNRITINNASSNNIYFIAMPIAEYNKLNSNIDLLDGSLRVRKTTGASNNRFDYEFEFYFFPVINNQEELDTQAAAEAEAARKAAEEAARRAAEEEAARLAEEAKKAAEEQAKPITPVIEKDIDNIPGIEILDYGDILYKADNKLIYKISDNNKAYYGDKILIPLNVDLLSVANVDPKYTKFKQASFLEQVDKLVVNYKLESGEDYVKDISIKPVTEKTAADGKDEYIDTTLVNKDCYFIVIDTKGNSNKENTNLKGIITISGYSGLGEGKIYIDNEIINLDVLLNSKGNPTNNEDKPQEPKDEKEPEEPKKTEEQAISFSDVSEEKLKSWFFEWLDKFFDKMFKKK